MDDKNLDRPSGVYTLGLGGRTSRGDCMIDRGGVGILAWPWEVSGNGIEGCKG